jgi:hypothetical protein
MDAPLLFTTRLSLVGDQLRKHNSPLCGFLAKWKQGQGQLLKKPASKEVSD